VNTLARRRTALCLSGAAGLAGLVAVTGCAMLGGNVKGSFSCAAPDGICAPSSSIDDRALATIAGDEGADLNPAGPYMENGPKPKVQQTALRGERTPVKPADTRRTQERVLRIVFQPYIDDRGRLHEASAIHAVVANGEWQQQALAAATPIPDRNALAMVDRPTSLADAIDRADPPGAVVTSIDPNLPDEAVVAAARARASDPVAGIKAEVAARLARKPDRPRRDPRGRISGAVPANVSPPVQAGATATAAVPAHAQPSTPPSLAPISSGAIGARAASPALPVDRGAPVTALPKTRLGSEAQARIKADPRYQARAAEIEQTAKQQVATPVVPGPRQIAPTMRAAGFPATVQEDN